MADFLGKDFRNTTENIDGNTYTQCTFDGCRLVYRGGEIPIFAGCKLERCVWVWDDAALRTIGFLRGIYSGMGMGGKQVIEEIVKEIRTPFPKGTT